MQQHVCSQGPGNTRVVYHGWCTAGLLTRPWAVEAKAYAEATEREAEAIKSEAKAEFAASYHMADAGPEDISVCWTFVALTL